jgi:hypothetical protein
MALMLLVVPKLRLEILDQGVDPVGDFVVLFGRGLFRNLGSLGFCVSVCLCHGVSPVCDLVGVALVFGLYDVLVQLRAPEGFVAGQDAAFLSIRQRHYDDHIQILDFPLVLDSDWLLVHGVFPVLVIQKILVTTCGRCYPESRPGGDIEQIYFQIAHGAPNGANRYED